jgi:hypothetical protein
MTHCLPDACTLPAAALPARLAEFDAVFATALREVEVVTPTHTRFRLGAAPDLPALLDRERECCAFFDFTVAPGYLDVRVPPAYAQVLAELTARAGRALG